MVHTSEQTRKFMDDIKNSNIKFKVDTDIEKRILKEDINDDIEQTQFTNNLIEEQKFRRLIRQKILKKIRDI